MRLVVGVLLIFTSYRLAQYAATVSDTLNIATLLLLAVALALAGGAVLLGK